MQITEATAVDQFGIVDGLTILDRLDGEPMTLLLSRIKKAVEISESRRLCAEQPGTTCWLRWPLIAAQYVA